MDGNGEETEAEGEGEEGGETNKQEEGRSKNRKQQDHVIFRNSLPTLILKDPPSLFLLKEPSVTDRLWDTSPTRFPLRWSCRGRGDWRGCRRSFVETARDLLHQGVVQNAMGKTHLLRARTVGDHMVAKTWVEEKLEGIEKWRSITLQQEQNDETTLVCTSTLNVGPFRSFARSENKGMAWLLSSTGENHSLTHKSLQLCRLDIKHRNSDEIGGVQEISSWNGFEWIWMAWSDLDFHFPTTLAKTCKTMSSNVFHPEQAKKSLLPASPSARERLRSSNSTFGFEEDRTRDEEALLAAAPALLDLDSSGFGRSGTKVLWAVGALVWETGFKWKLSCGWVEVQVVSSRQQQDPKPGNLFKITLQQPLEMPKATKLRILILISDFDCGNLYVLLNQLGIQKSSTSKVVTLNKSPPPEPPGLWAAKHRRPSGLEDGSSRIALLTLHGVIAGGQLLMLMLRQSGRKTKVDGLGGSPETLVSKEFLTAKLSLSVCGWSFCKKHLTKYSKSTGWDGCKIFLQRTSA